MSRNIAAITIDLEMSSSATMASSKKSSTAPIRKNDLICQLKGAEASAAKFIAKCDKDGAPPVLTATEKRAHVEALRLALPLLAKERQRLMRRKASLAKARDASIRRMVATLRRRRCDRRAFRPFSVKASLSRFAKGSKTKPDLYDLYVLGRGYDKQCTKGHKRKRDMMEAQGFKRTDRIPTAAKNWSLACKAHPRLLYLCMDTAKQHPTYWTWRDVKEYSAVLKALLLGQTRGGYRLSDEEIAWLKAADEVDLVKQCKTKPSSVLDAEKLPTIDVCFQDRWGDTALMHAARKGGVSHVRALLEHGGTSLAGDVNKEQLMKMNIKGDTALMIAQKKEGQEFTDIVALLEKAAGEE